MKNILTILTIMFLPSILLAGESLPNNFYNPIDSMVPATNVLCKGNFYAHNESENPYSQALKNGKLLLEFNEYGNANEIITGNDLELHIYSTQQVGDDKKVYDMTIVIEAKFIGSNFKTIEYIDYANTSNVASLQVAGDEHIYISCYPTKM